MTQNEQLSSARVIELISDMFALSRAIIWAKGKNGY